MLAGRTQPSGEHAKCLVSQDGGGGKQPSPVRATHPRPAGSQPASPPLLQPVQPDAPSPQRVAQLRRPGQDRALRDRCRLPSSTCVAATRRAPGEMCSSTNITPRQNDPQSLPLLSNLEGNLSQRAETLSPASARESGQRPAVLTAAALRGVRTDTSRPARPTAAACLQSNRKMQLKARPGKYLLLNAEQQNQRNGCCSTKPRASGAAAASSSVPTTQLRAPCVRVCKRR